MVNNVIYSAFLVCDRIGRIWATRQLCLLWIIGIAIFMANGGSLSAVYAGRFVVCLGIGQTVVVAPVYLAEIVSLFTNYLPNPSAKFYQVVAGSHSWCLHLFFFFTGFVYLGIVLAYFANYGCALHLGDTTHARWVSLFEVFSFSYSVCLHLISGSH
jgi:putative flippase GtrA